MRTTSTPSDRWHLVYGLMERWAALPIASWRMLIDAERLTADAGPVLVPRDYEQWMLRDLVETTWWIASRREIGSEEPWMADARRALERTALRLLASPSLQRSGATAINHRIRVHRSR